VRALVLAPTRELAAQVQESVDTYGKHLPLTSAVIFGGVKINPQIAQLRRGVDILVATPGRLLDHAGQGTLDLSASRSWCWTRPTGCSTWASSTTSAACWRSCRDQRAPEPALLRHLLGRDQGPRQPAVEQPQADRGRARNTAAETVSQVVHPVDRHRKRELLSHLVGANDWRQVLVFTRTKHGANRLAEQLDKDGLTAAAIHGNKSQGARTRALAGFKTGDVRVLVATDIAARGLDIDQLPHVVNFELPNVPEDYVHRIGRTGRAGNEGEAISLVCVDEHKLLRDIERLLKARGCRGRSPQRRPACRRTGDGGTRRTRASPRSRSC
jgi:ATP-dependent RNA helicase RhlE